MTNFILSWDSDHFIEKELYSNDSIQYLIATNYTNFFIFPSRDFRTVFYNNKSIHNIFKNYRENKGDGSEGKTDYFYKKIKEIIKGENLIEKLNWLFIDLNLIQEKIETNNNEMIYNFISNIGYLQLLKLIFSPIFLLKKEGILSNINQLNDCFYKRLLYIIGIKEEKERKSKKIKIVKDKTRKYSLLTAIENNIYEPNIYNFETNLNIAITWISRLLFIKLLESLLRKINNNQKITIINENLLTGFNIIEELFFKVLGEGGYVKDFDFIPYLNSSL